MREEYKKVNDESRPLFSLTVGEFKALLRSVIECAQNNEAKVIPLAIADTHGKEVFCIKGLMDFLRCSKASVHNYKKRGLPFYRVGRKVLFRKEEVLAFMKECRRKKSSRALRRAA